MGIITYHTVKCPYCGAIHHVKIKMGDLTKSAVFYCDACDRQYVIQVVLLPKVTTFELTPAGSVLPIEEYDQRRDIEAPAVQ